MATNYFTTCKPRIQVPVSIFNCFEPRQVFNNPTSVILPSSIPAIESMLKSMKGLTENIMIQTHKELAAACLNVAQNYKTLYIMGCFGAPMTVWNKKRYLQNYSYNQQADRQVMIKSATADTFGFDCVCLIKGLLWGWNGKKRKPYGGATYASNGVPDVTADGMMALCENVSTDFSNIEVGELLWMSGHVGIYIGNGQAVECTPAWKNGVQVTTVLNVKPGTGREWMKHGKLPWITYDAAGSASSSAAADTKTSSVSELPTPGDI